jgi:hypothetical protein
MSLILNVPEALVALGRELDSAGYRSVKRQHASEGAE